MKKALEPIAKVMRQACRLDLSRYAVSFLTKSVEARMTATDCLGPAAYAVRLAEDGAEREAFRGALNINYSEFFRHPLTFALLEQVVLPRLVEAKRESPGAEIRVWSAGCAAGQEAYSVAILLEDMAAARGGSIPYRIFASDTSEGELTAARQGVYGSEAVQNVRLRHLRSYFIQQGSTYMIAPRLRGRMDFSACDLLDERTSYPPSSIFGDFDLVFCCNLLFYYRPPMQKVILDKVRQSLAERGCFVTGEAEWEIAESAGGFRALSAPAPVFESIRLGK